ncbi:LuxR family transcriptional regulator [Mycobacterium sp. CBMA293]|uniref:helix-turn-helix transcriptional regulator n=1 Tax=unclassified Mycolicibacterium TaxID=2636767 RepID=UPI00132B6F8B|nr:MULTISPECIES: response regulator transcription factor [unclassified Mycolicibacterium]MUL46516.1 LuxR family transcriptional regulator [Mycolicibacterium sp. CBMA 360]MUL94543.1 LuxR family transcriptional regulator [Mycolicibacterium sp. CBMA 230]MUM31544.1 LuxR family transcriptional regulator [Mycolicibacterium sp. CBMA 361]MUL59185.1 LuxR family transcriptional regulator [Mycolicibacterium sp. CBMA 335]MUL69579.1 LuxR family transcriptional regulator [Mycolicibacterium sp. CBMA 311]
MRTATTQSDDLPWPLLDAVASIAGAPLAQIAERLRTAALPYIRCTALVIFTEDCTGRPQKKAGAETIISRVSIAELDDIRATLSDETPWEGDAELAGRPRPVLALKHAASGALLVLADPQPTDVEHDAGLDVVTYLWRIAAQRIQEKVADAPPSYLLESRAASAERIRVTAELTDLHSTTLETLLAALRSSSMNDAAARIAVTDLAARALVGLRTLNDRTTDMAEVPVAIAFERLREDLRPLTRFSGLEVEFIEPPQNGRALPGEVAHAGRAIVRGLVLAMMEQPQISRVRTQWDCDGENLLINVRDDGRGMLAADSPSIGRLDRQVQALDGQLRIDVMSGWGADVFVTLPLDLQTRPTGNIAGWDLAARELEVLQHLVAGHRNRTIALTLGISENTVKFHVRNLFRKLDVSSRTEAIALANSHGVR